MLNVITAVLDDLHRLLLPNTDGDVATYIPELADADPDVFGLALCTPDGATYEAGSSDAPFTIQSVSKPFTMALAIADAGLDAVLAAVGVEPTGDPFNAVTLEEGTGRPLNPMVNAGAIVTSSLVAGADAAARAQRIVQGLSAFAGRPLEVDQSVLASEMATADRNRAISFLMRSMGALPVEVEDALVSYVTQCSVVVTARDLAVMGATLANGGRNPLTDDDVVSAEVATHVLSVMATCGLYDFSGEWLFRTGMPAKSGVGGGISVVLPGELGIGTFSPRLDARGNSVRGIAACEALSERYGLHSLRGPRTRTTPAVHRRRQGDAARSRRSRPRREREVLARDGGAIVIYELQGDLTFADAERIARQATTEAARWLILDGHRVGRVDGVAAALLGGTALMLAERGVEVDLAGPWDPAALAVVEQRFEHADDAMARCEDILVAEAGLPGPEAPVPLADNDLCAALSADELAVLEAAGTALSFAPGDELDAPGEPRHSIMFVTMGRVAVKRIDDLTGGRPLAVRAAGTAVGSVADPSSELIATRLVAELPTTVLALSPGVVQSLQSDHPHLATALFRAVAESIVSDYRDIAAENAALTE